MRTAKPKQPSASQKAKIANEILKVRESPLYFAETYAWTLDEDHEPGESPIKQFPSPDQRPDLYELMDIWTSTQVLAVDKSRQMMGTWAFVTAYLWMTAFHQGKRVFFQSKKEKDAINLLERAWFIYQRVPQWLKVPHQKKESELIFDTLDSIIWAIPQGGDHIRSYTASGILSDEAAKQPELEEAYAASLPSIGKHGKLTLLSTPRGKGNFFYRIMKDK